MDSRSPQPFITLTNIYSYDTLDVIFVLYLTRYLNLKCNANCLYIRVPDAKHIHKSVEQCCLTFWGVEFNLHCGTICEGFWNMFFGMTGVLFYGGVGYLFFYILLLNFLMFISYTVQGERRLWFSARSPTVIDGLSTILSYHWS